MYFLNFNLRKNETLKPPNPQVHASHSVNERCRLVVHVRALGYFKVLPQNLPGDTEENNYITFLCFVIHQYREHT